MEVFGDEKVDARNGHDLVNERIDARSIPAAYNRPYMTGTPWCGAAISLSDVASCSEVGGLDENFVGAAQHEDADLAFRLHQHGCKVVWAPGPGSSICATGRARKNPQPRAN